MLHFLPCEGALELDIKAEQSGRRGISVWEGRVGGTQSLCAICMEGVWRGASGQEAAEKGISSWAMPNFTLGDFNLP